MGSFIDKLFGRYQICLYTWWQYYSESLHFPYPNYSVTVGPQFNINPKTN